MVTRLQVTWDAGGACPRVEVPQDRFYELVEFLSWHRVVVRYDFEGEHFLIHFGHMTVEAAQGLMDMWAGCESAPARAAEPRPNSESAWSEVLVG